MAKSEGSFQWAQRISLLVLSVSSACHSGGANVDDGGSSTCEVKNANALRSEFDAYRLAALPNGDCDGATTCSIRTHDVCPGTDYPGPNQLWQCSCDAHQWQCKVIESSKAACLPDADSGTTDSDAGSERPALPR